LGQRKPAFYILHNHRLCRAPALVAGLTYYALSIYKHEKNSTKNSLLLLMLAIQTFHISWITDELVYDSFFGSPSRSVEIPYYAV
jgi:hypothetical protein